MILLFLFVILGFGMTFVTGFFVARYMAAEGIKPLAKNISITPSPKAPNKEEIIPGNRYFVDTIIAIAKDNPHITLTATTSRTEKDGKYTQSSRVSYFDGSEWKRKTGDTYNTKTADIAPSDLIKDWSSIIDPSRVLKQSVSGAISFDNTAISYDVKNLENEIGMRSLPGYTKFMSQNTGTLTIDGNTYPAYILYTRIYSMNVSEIQFYDNSFGLTTNWIAFWDEDGNFYHLDSTDVDTATDIYDTHQIGVFSDSNRGIYKTFSTAVVKNKDGTYNASFKSPINRSLTFALQNELDKAPDPKYTWFMGVIDGSTTDTNGTKVKGYGLMEYIHD